MFPRFRGCTQKEGCNAFLHNSPKVSLFIDLEETHDDHADRASEHQPEQK